MVWRAPAYLPLRLTEAWKAKRREIEENEFFFIIALFELLKN